MAFNREGSNGGNLNLTSAGLSTGTTTSTVQHTAALTYLIDARFFTKAATNNIPVTGRSLAIGERCAFLVGINAAGNYTFLQGATVPSDQTAPIPAAPESVAVIGGFVVTATTAAYVPGTTALGTGNTVAYYQLASAPGLSTTLA